MTDQTKNPPASARIALITGASRGIGRSAALALAKQGVHVIALARTVGALEELDDAISALGGTASLIPVDLRDSTALNHLQPALLERFTHIDIFVANAGILGELAPIGDISPSKWDETLAVNLTANWRLTAILDPLLRQSQAARVVYVTSSVARDIRAYWGGYAISKAGLEALAQTYAAEVVHTSIKVNLLNPGATRTAMRAAAMPGENPATLPNPDAIAPLVVEMTHPTYAQHGALVHYRDWATHTANNAADPSCA